MNHNQHWILPWTPYLVRIIQQVKIWYVQKYTNCYEDYDSEETTDRHMNMDKSRCAWIHYSQNMENRL